MTICVVTILELNCDIVFCEDFGSYDVMIFFLQMWIELI